MLEYPEFNLFLIRHGQSEANTRPEYLGQSSESPLTKLGEAQANALGNRLRDDKIRFDRIYSSSYPRALRTAQIVTDHLEYKHDFISVHSELREYDAGDWKGKKRQEVLTNNVKMSMAYFNNAFRPPEGESLNMVERRVSEWFDHNIMFNKDIINYSNGIKKISKRMNIAIFSHGMSIKCLLHYFMNFEKSLTWKIKLENTSISNLTFNEDGWGLNYINNFSHLYNMDI